VTILLQSLFLVSFPASWRHGATVIIDNWQLVGEWVLLSLCQVLWFSLEQCSIIIEGLFPPSTAAFFTHERAIGNVGFVDESVSVGIFCPDQFWVLGPSVQGHKRNFVLQRCLSLYHVVVLQPGKLLALWQVVFGG